MRKLGLQQKDLKPMPHTKLRTAKEGTQLQILGELSASVPLRFGGLPKAFPTRFVVIEGLTHDINISGPFLRANKIDQLHSKDALRIDGHLVPLSVPRKRRLYPKEASAVYVVGDVTVPPYSNAYIKLRAPEVEKRVMRDGDGFLEGNVTFAEKNNVHTWTGALVHCSADGKLHGGVLNTTHEPIRIPSGSRYGDLTTATPAHEIEDGENTGSIAYIEPPEAGKNGADATDKVDKTSWLVKEFKILDNPLLADPKRRARAMKLLLKHASIFAVDGSFGRTSLLEHHIETTPGPPIRCKSRPFNPVLEDNLRTQLEEWLKHDVIEPSTSPWSFPLVPIPKKNGKMRWCVDYRRLNARTVKDAFPLPNIEDTLSRLAHSKIFSAIDGSGAFHVVAIAKGDKEKTAFSTPMGSYHFKRMPFGLCNAPATYSRLVQMVLAGIPYSMALPYLDDTCIHSANFNDHIDALDRVFAAYGKAGLKLQPSKCQLFADKIEYLGHEITPEGIRPLASHLQAITSWPFPDTVEKVRTFLGKTGYYRRFIEQYSLKAKPLSDCLAQEPDHQVATKTHKKSSIAGTPQQHQAFEELKKSLLTSPILAYPDFTSGEPFILDTDWSRLHNTIGAVLGQKQKGLERVIAYGAKKLPSSCANYTSHKGELAAVIHFFKHWRYYLQPRKFILRTDNAALKWIRSMDTPSGMIARWIEVLAAFDFTVVHRMGTKHQNAEALSRIDHAPAMTPQEAPDDERILYLGDLQDAIMQIIPEEDYRSFNTEELVELQKEDPTLRHVRHWVLINEGPTMHDIKALSFEQQWYAHILPELKINRSGVLCKKTRQQANSIPLPARPCVPAELQLSVVKAAHLTGGHMGVEATTRRIQQQLYFPGTKKIVADFIARCRVCQTKRGPPKQQLNVLIPTSAGYPFQVISIDFVGPLETTSKGNKHILTVKDCFTRWLEAFPVPAQTAKATVQLLEEHIFCRFGIPERIHSDMGTQFTSNLFHLVAETYGIEVTTTPAYSPKSNSVERAHRDLGPMLKAITNEAKIEWDEALTPALFALRTAVCRNTGSSPFQLLFGTNPRTPLSVLFGDPNPIDKSKLDHITYVRTLRKKLDAAHEFARANIQDTVERQRRLYNSERKLFTVGAKVWLFTPVTKPSKSRKLSIFWTGPWIVEKKINQVMYEIAPAPEMERKVPKQQVSVDRLKIYRVPLQPPNLLPPIQEPPEDDFDADDEEEAEVIHAAPQPNPQVITNPMPQTPPAAASTPPTPPRPTKTPQNQPPHARTHKAPLFPATPPPAPPSPPNLQTPPYMRDPTPPPPPPPPPTGRQLRANPRRNTKYDKDYVQNIEETGSDSQTESKEPEHMDADDDNEGNNTSVLDELQQVTGLSLGTTEQTGTSVLDEINLRTGLQLGSPEPPRDTSSPRTRTSRWSGSPQGARPEQQQLEERQRDEDQQRRRTINFKGRQPLQQYQQYQRYQLSEEEQELIRQAQARRAPMARTPDKSESEIAKFLKQARHDEDPK